MAAGSATPRLRSPLAIGTAITVAAALGMDVRADEHPTHTLGLALTTLAVAGVRLWTRGHRGGLLRIVACALMAQPALHAMSKLGGGHRFQVENGVLHVIVEDGPATMMQVVVPALIIVAVGLAARVVDVVIGVVSRPARLLISPPPAPLRAVRVAIDSLREGSMLRWCGWRILSARRGPPPDLLLLVTPPSGRVRIGHFQMS